MSIKSELLSQRGADGLIRVDRTHDWAVAHPESALYRALDWNDQSAARKYRLHQIRLLIAVHIVDADGNRQTISLLADRGAGGGYRDTEAVFDHAEMRQMALREALAEFTRVRERYEYLTEMAAVYEALDAVHVPAPRARRNRAIREDRPAA